MLHDPNGVSKCLEIEHEIVALCAPVEPRPEFDDIVCGQLAIAVFVGEFDDRGWSQPAIEVVV